MAEKTINVLTINDFPLRIVDPDILKLFPEENYEPLLVLNKSVIISGKRKNICILQHYSYILYRKIPYINHGKLDEGDKT